MQVRVETVYEGEYGPPYARVVFMLGYGKEIEVVVAEADLATTSPVVTVYGEKWELYRHSKMPENLEKLLTAD